MSHLLRDFIDQTRPHHFGPAAAIVSGLAVVSIAIGDTVATEGMHLGYYVATFTGIGFLASVVKFWVWFEDRQKKEIAASEARMRDHVDTSFKAHNELQKAQFAAISAEIKALHRR